MRGPVAAVIAGAVAVVGCGSAPAPAAPGPTRSPAVTRSAAGLPSASASAVHSMLEQTWEAYRTGFIGGDGRVADPGRNGGSTSEGQSYALLRAVWMDDRQTFDSVWRWTRTALQTRGDHLFAYLWGDRGGGDHAVLDSHSATDADTDIALALLLAARRWGDPAYRDAAHAIAGDIWALETTDAGGMRVITGGDWATRQTQPGPVFNPSYFAPYAYRILAAEDSSHPWMSLVDSAYALLARCSVAALGGRGGVGLPPNWFAISDRDGSITPFAQIDRADDYGYDAFRVMWRVALDYQWNHDARARDYLQSSSFLRTRWQQDGRLVAVYGHDGSVVSAGEDPTVYGGDIGNFLVTDAASAQRILDQKLLASFTGSGASAHFGDASNYYEQNWVWFGIALAGAALDDFRGEG